MTSASARAASCCSSCGRTGESEIAAVRAGGVARAMTVVTAWRRWRSLDLGTTMVFLQAHAPRVRCRQHGIVVAVVPWARHGAGRTREFDEQVAWLATRC